MNRLSRSLLAQLCAGALASLIAAAPAFAGEVQPYRAARFDALTNEGKPVIVAVHASWCPTCKAQAPIVMELMSRPAYKDVTLLMVDFDADKPALGRFKVGMQSTLVAFKGSKEVARSVGDTTPEGLEGLVKKTVQ